MVPKTMLHSHPFQFATFVFWNLSWPNKYVAIPSVSTPFIARLSLARGFFDHTAGDDQLLDLGRAFVDAE